MSDPNAKFKTKRNSKAIKENELMDASNRSDVDTTEMNFLKSGSSNRINSFNDGLTNDSLNASHESNIPNSQSQNVNKF